MNLAILFTLLLKIVFVTPEFLQRIIPPVILQEEPSTRDKKSATIKNSKYVSIINEKEMLRSSSKDA
jgi:hypothetical protein